MDFLEKYGGLHLDAGISRAYSTLHAVRNRCSQVSDEMMGKGKRRAKIMVETIETRYHEALAAKETMSEKITTGISLLEGILSDFEARAYKMKNRGFVGAAETLLDEGRRVVGEAAGRARDAVDEGFETAKKAAMSIEDHIAHAIKVAREKGSLHYEDLPMPWRVNPHILRGYRFSETKVACIHSVFSFSNETFNIWSHGLGLLIILSIAFYFYPTSDIFSTSTQADVFIAAVFFAAACKCMICSTMWHTMNSVADQTLLERFACVDYTGISLLIAASIMTTEYTAFYCDSMSRNIYMILTAALGIGGVILPWHPFFNRADMAWARVAFYVALGASGFLPMFQLSWERGSLWAWHFYAPIAKSIGVYLLGAVLYASKIPERWYPGAFDYLGGSHNLWHCAVLAGILFHYVAMQEFFAGAFERATSECVTY